MRFKSELNDDQLNGLANLCFDLAKLAFALAVLPAQMIIEEPLVRFIQIIVGLSWGLVLTMLALVILRKKRRIKK